MISIKPLQQTAAAILVPESSLPLIAAAVCCSGVVRQPEVWKMDLRLLDGKWFAVLMIAETPGSKDEWAFFEGTATCRAEKGTVCFFLKMIISWKKNAVRCALFGRSTHSARSRYATPGRWHLIRRQRCPRGISITPWS